ncbi:hypothetical protein VP01_4656g1 [Puccinia sorghi]|uniref:Uncharacterized protein n=1 Tax=Puccinia sorghi TaxID=27349 RepID=A0A0L6UN91_9BASI|nr:hypothetical protein VP01_4656g1 [Puccinia sorghi]
MVQWMVGKNMFSSIIQQMVSSSPPSTPSSVTQIGFTSSDLLSLTPFGAMDSFDIDPSLPPYTALAPITTNIGATKYPQPPAENAALKNSNIFRVLGIGPPMHFDCSISFTIYCSEKTKRNSTNWVTLRQFYDLSVTFNTNNTMSWPTFQHLVADQCNNN